MPRKRRVEPELNPPERLHLAFEVSQRFIETDWTLAEIAEDVGLRHVEMVRRSLKYAVANGVLRFVPPLNELLAAQIASAYKLSKERVLVVNPSTLGRDKRKGSIPIVDPTRVQINRSSLSEPVALRAARLVMRLILKVGADKWPRGEAVTIGITSGRSGQLFCRALSKLIRYPYADGGDDGVYPPLPKGPLRLGRIKIVALSATCPVHESQYTSSAAFQCFRGLNVQTIILSSHTLVEQSEYASGKIQKLSGIREALAEKDNIDIAVTGMGAFADGHDNLRNSMLGSDVPEHVLTQLNYLGSFQFRPFSAKGPIKERDGDLRAVTVLELADFKRMVKQGKHVVLMARECGLCDKVDRSAVLKPLLTQPSLKICNNFVLDAPTAFGLVI